MRQTTTPVRVADRSRPLPRSCVGGTSGSALAQDQVAARRDGLARARRASRSGTTSPPQFEAAHPGVDVEMNYQDDDLYQTIGLPNLLAGPNAPDIYFEWTGSRMAQRYADGYAADLTEAVTTGPLAGLCSTTRVFPAASVDGKVVLVPHTADVTNVLFYNMPLLAEHGLTPPTTWEELLAACDALIAADVIPIATRQQGPVGGRQLAQPPGRPASWARRSTTPRSAATGKFATPEWEQAFGYIAAAARARLRQRERQRHRRQRGRRSCSSRARPRCTPSARGW